MRSHCDETAWRLRRGSVFVGLALTLLLFATAAEAQTQPAEPKPAEQKAPEPKPAEQRAPEICQTFYLVNASQHDEFNDIQTALRNTLSRARIYGVFSQGAISIRGSAEELAETPGPTVPLPSPAINETRD